MGEIVKIRRANPSDVAGLLGLMQQLAQFEGYCDAFKQTETSLLQHGFPNAMQGGGIQVRPTFKAWVAEAANRRLLAYAVVIEIPFTYDLRVNWLLKEFFVDADARGQGVGQCLFQELLNAARAAGVGRIKWDVLPNNTNAKLFYQAQGARQVAEWEAWILEL